MNLPRKYRYRAPLWSLAVLLCFSGAAGLLSGWRFHSAIAGVVLGGVPVLWVLLAIRRHYFTPRYVELGSDAVIICEGVVRRQVRQIPYVEIQDAVEVTQGSHFWFYLYHHGRRDGIFSQHLPSIAGYQEIRDYVQSGVLEIQGSKPPPKAIPGAYVFRCSSDGNGGIYNSIEELLWRLESPQANYFGAWLLSRLWMPLFIVRNPAGQEVMRARRARPWALGRSIVYEKGVPVCVIHQANLLFNRYTLKFAQGEVFEYRLPLFTVFFQGHQGTQSVFQVRLWAHQVWLVKVEPPFDTLQLLAALAFLHRERLRLI